jgi:uncharacterized protein YcnI
MNKTTLAAVTTVAALAVPGVAAAHVTLQPNTATAGAYTVENVRVPNEQDNAVTTKVDVQMPHGFVAASYEATRGWTVKVTKTKLAKPMQTDDGPIDEEVSRISWTADSKADGIKPGEFRDFPISVQIPGQAGDKLTFKALQTYSNGDVVRWIGAPDADQPAPQVTVTAAAAEGGHAAVSSTTKAVSHPATPPSSDSSDGASKGLAVAALVAGLLGIALGATALVRRRA